LWGGTVDSEVYNNNISWSSVCPYLTRRTATCDRVVIFIINWLQVS
jgi:hypothetical protein